MRKKNPPLFLAKCEVCRNIPSFQLFPHLQCTKASRHSPETWSLTDSCCFLQLLLSLKKNSISLSRELIRTKVGIASPFSFFPLLPHITFARILLLLRRPRKQIGTCLPLHNRKEFPSFASTRFTTVPRVSFLLDFFLLVFISFLLSFLFP